MKAGAALAAMEGLPVITPAAFTRGAPFVVLAPHPDDESLGVGGLIAAARDGGTPVRIVFVTDGAGSHPGSKHYAPPALTALRKEEARAAAALLNVPSDHLVHLDLPDTAAPQEGPQFDAAVERIAAVVQEAGASLLLVTWGYDPHCDHEAAAAMARAVRAAVPGLAVWAYPVWGRHLDPATEIATETPSGYRLDIAPWLDAKRRAIAAHVSQMTELIADDPDGFRFTPAKLAPFMEPHEIVLAVPA